MSLFRFGGTTGGAQVDVPPAEVWVSRVTHGGTGRATFADFVLEPRLTCKSIFYGSTQAGPSYARLEGVTGEPVATQVDVESSNFLVPGDRVSIGYQEGGNYRGIFAGYFTQVQIQITDNDERIVYRLAGPEWAWGAKGANSGADALAYGQWRRSAASDNAWVTTPSTITARAGLALVRATKCLFNPRGTKNRTLTKVHFDGSGTGEEGYVFEEPDRGRIEAGARTDKASYWTRKTAIHHLLHLYNDADFSGIVNPEFGNVDPTVAGDVMRDVDVDGMGLFDAVAKACGPGLFAAVHPVPEPGEKWGGFTVNAYSRSSGTVASLFLDPRGTSMGDATPSVNRLEAVKDIAKTANRVIVYGQGVRHVTLRFNADPDKVTTDEKPYTLQPGWVSASPNEGYLSDFAGTGSVVDERSIDSKGATLAAQWKARYTTTGAEFPKYAHVFRKFVWNEGGEYQGAGLRYGTTSKSYFAPDLTTIADAKGFVHPDDYEAGDYARRRRPLLSSAYTLPNTEQRVRMKPVVWISTAYKPAFGGTAPVAADYKYHLRVPETFYRIDRDTAAIWITVADIAKWKPFDALNYDKARDDPSLGANAVPTAEWIQGLTFATLLHRKRVWLTIEASIECDMPARAMAERQNTSGSPHLRQVLIRRPDAYIKSIAADQSALGSHWTTFSGLTASAIDDTADMQTYADQSRAAGQDEQVEASVLCEADAPIQSIGKMVGTIGGRNIDLTNSSGRGAQIVAISLDLDSLTVEHLTETAAMEVVAAEKNRITRSKVYQRGGIRQ